MTSKAVTHRSHAPRPVASLAQSHAEEDQQPVGYAVRTFCREADTACLATATYREAESLMIRDAERPGLRSHAERGNDMPPTPLAVAIRCILASGLFCLAPAGQAADHRLPLPAQTWVSAGQAAQQVKGNKLTIQQATDRVTLNWRSFDIGKDASVAFQQPSATSIALNRIDQANPSDIQGRLSANGQIYLVNHNGFVFGAASRVDANTLVATNLDISDDTLQRGITKVLGQDGSAALNGSGAVYLRDAAGNYLLDAQGQRQKIQITLAPGAQISSSAGGRVLLAAPKVDNQGSIATPDGQTLLVAGTDKVYLQEAGSDSDIRGLLVEVQTGGEARNSGSIAVGKGNATLLGYAVNQDGLVSAKTSVRSNGSIRLLARENAQTLQQDQTWQLQPGTTRRAVAADDGLGDRATLSLGGASVTEVLPDSADATTAVDSQPQTPSSVTLQGNVVSMANGALIHAPAGKVSLTATEHPDNPGQAGVSNDSRVYLAAGSKIDVAGMKNVELPMSSNVVALELRSNELRDSPLQKSGMLNGKTVYVDVRRGTPLADISGAVAQIARGVDERSSDGGSVALYSEGAVVAQQGALVDVSGGAVNYQAGAIHTSQLVADDGSVVDIGDADPNRRYIAVLGDLSATHERWGVTERWGLAGPMGQGLFQAGYTQGKNAGSVDIQANQLLLDGRVLAATLLDLQQRFTVQPLGGSLNIDLARAPDSLQSILFQQQATPTDFQKPELFREDAAAFQKPELFREDAAALALDAPFPLDAEQRPAPLLLNAQRFVEDGLSRLSFKTNGIISIAKDALVQLQSGGSFAASGGEIAVAGNLTVPGGSVALQTQLTSTTQGVLSGGITLQPGSSIDVSGVFVNDTGLLRTQHLFEPATIHGGSVSIETDQGDLTVAEYAAIHADGGAWLDQSGRTSAGRGGAITLTAAGIDGSNLVLGGELSAYALLQGGTLNLTTHEFLLGGAEGEVVSGQWSVVSEDRTLTPLHLSEDFFRQGGFSQYNLAANLNGISVADGAHIHPQTLNLLFNQDPRLLSSGSAMRAITHTALLPESLRRPADLSLSLVQSVGRGREDAGISVGQGASLVSDAQGSITLASDASIFVKGSVTAPAGTLTLTITPPSAVEPGFLPNQGIWLDSGSRLSVQGTALLQNTELGLTEGRVLDGGRLTLTANRGYIATAPGSVLDASGSSAMIDIPGAARSGQAANPVATRLASAGGSITLATAEGLILGGNVNAGPGAGETLPGGSLSITLNPNLRLEPVEPLPPEQQFLRTTPVILLNRRPQDVMTQDEWDTHTLPLTLNGQAYLSTDQVDQAQLAELTLNSTNAIRANETLTLSVTSRLTLDAPQIQWGGGEAGNLALHAAYIAIGSSRFRQILQNPAAGQGRLSAEADLIDLLGAAALDGFTDSHLTSQGDIRLRGIRVLEAERDFIGQLSSVGDLTLEAAQVYTTTLSDYTIDVTGEHGTLHFAGAGERGTVWSVGGKLTASADTIVQSGVLKAPQGEIHLNAASAVLLTDGSNTSVSLDGALVPFGRTQGGLDWLYPLGLQNLVLDAPPQKNITLDAPAVSLQNHARLDLSGGGDLFAFEFIKGPGGSVDVLDPQDPAVLDGSVAYQPKFAILPEAGAFAPYDPLEFPASGLKVGDSVYLSAGSGLPAGNYALLPAHYALLPGAYLVTPQQGTLFDGAVGGAFDAQVQPTLTQADGSVIVAGYRGMAGTGLHDARWSGFAVAPGSLAGTYSEYQESYANQFFADKAARDEVAAPLLPQDAGRLVLQAAKSLVLDGSVQAAAAGDGIGGRLDVDATRLLVVPANSLTPTLSRGEREQTVAGTVTLVAEDLMQMNLSSLVLGGVRSEKDGETRVRTTAKTVTVAAGTVLQKADILLTAKDSLSIGADAVLSGSAEDASAPQTTSFLLDGNNALLHLSNGAPAALTGQDQAGGDATLTVAAGARLSADGSMLLNAGGNMRLHGRLASAGGDVQLGAGRISLGDAPAGTAGLVLSQALLQDVQAGQLLLRSPNPIAVYGAAALQQGNLVLDSAGLTGMDNAGETAVLSADTLTFTNSDQWSVVSGQNAAPMDGRDADTPGTLRVSAQTLILGAGDYALDGYGHVTLRGTDLIQGEGSGTLHAAADLTLQADRFGGANGADTAIDAAGYRVESEKLRHPSPPLSLGERSEGWGRGEGSVARVGQNNSLAAGMGARWNIQADAVSTQGQFVLPAGQLHLSALRGDLDVAEGAVLDVSGRALPLAGSTLYADGGLISLTAGQGDIHLAGGALLDVSAPAGGGNAGSVSLSAVQGRVDVRATLAGSSDAGAAGFALDTQNLTSEQLAALTQNLADHGFARAISIRQRAGDMTIAAGTAIQAGVIELSTDQGALNLAGTLDTSVNKGGTVTLAGGRGVGLDGGARIITEGGDVILDASVGDDFADSRIQLAQGSSIKVAGGSVTLRAPRLDDSQDIAIDALAGDIIGARRINAEAVAVYQSNGDIAKSDIAGWKSATAQYMQNAAAVETRLGAGVDLVPALDVRSDADLTLQNGWDLLSWRYNGQPGVLTLRAAGNLNLQADLSDAFADGVISTPFGEVTRDNLPQAGASWSYRLVAGGDVNLDKGVLVRTGTGSISVDAGQDLLLGDDASRNDRNAAIYTAGQPDTVNRYGGFSDAIVGFLFYGEYPQNGGDIRIQAGRDVQGAVTRQVFSDWLVRTGAWSATGADGNTLPTAWAVNLQDTETGSGFNQGIGALGGGNVTVQAGGNIANLSVVIPTTGKQLGTPANPGSIYDVSFSSNQVLVQGGGDLHVQAAGDISGGLYYTGQGQAAVTAGGSLGGSGREAPWFALGDGQLSVDAGGNITVGGVFNPTMLPQPTSTMAQNSSYFFTYSADSAASFVSRAGSVVLQNDVDQLLAATALGDLADSNDAQMMRVYPAQVTALAPVGDITVERDFLLYPSAQGRLALAAGGNIGTSTTGNAVTITESDADPLLLPNVQLPAQDLIDAYNRLQPYGSADFLHAVTPLHAGDLQRAEILAETGDIAGTDPLRFVLATAAKVYAGHDIRDVSFNLQNNNVTDISEVIASRDIRYLTERDPLTGNLLNLTQEISASGPGQLQVMAGRNIDLGSSQGIFTLGTQANPALPQGGASISVLAGLTAQGIATLDDQSGAPAADGTVDFSGAYAAFIETYLEGDVDRSHARRGNAARDALRPVTPLARSQAGNAPADATQSVAGFIPTRSVGTINPDYAPALIAYMQPYNDGKTLSHGEALTRFKALPVEAQRKFLLDVMYTEVREAGSAAAQDPKLGNQRGFDAIAAMFPGEGYQGDLTLFFSKIHTVDGGDIGLAVPGGLVNAGLAVAFSGAKPSSDLGIVAQRYGAIDAVVHDDFLVNQSRVFALDGGDITLWSSAGNIDAGRGAKTSLAVPPPIVTFDAKGNLQVIFPPVVSGSGIRTAASSADKTPGDVYLFAPQGVVDAGEAGIGGNNVTIGATAVIGATNIQVGGSSTGVPVAPTVNIGAIAGAGNVASSVAQSAQQTSGGAMDKATDKNAFADSSLATAILDVDVLGWGD
ncbi:MAG: filamentous hemagglutinin N-terminal domain-containing protein [Methylococcaceae bacterium]|nr:MAG: filamentous hemagglutinin N-terminal domain-containing protein [Methylococcaceae bacterium]